MLAMAGLSRLGLLDAVATPLDPLLLMPAPAQGVLAVECRTDDPVTAAQLRTLDHAPTRATAITERSFLATLDVGCGAPVGAWRSAAREQRPERRTDGNDTGWVGWQGHGGDPGGSVLAPPGPLLTTTMAQLRPSRSPAGGQFGYRPAGVPAWQPALPHPAAAHAPSASRRGAKPGAMITPGFEVACLGAWSSWRRPP